MVRLMKGWGRRGLLCWVFSCESSMVLLSNMRAGRWLLTRKTTVLSTAPSLHQTLCWRTVNSNLSCKTKERTFNRNGCRWAKSQKSRVFFLLRTRLKLVNLLARFVVQSVCVCVVHKTVRYNTTQYGTRQLQKLSDLESCHEQDKKLNKNMALWSMLFVSTKTARFADQNQLEPTCQAFSANYYPASHPHLEPLFCVAIFLLLWLFFLLLFSQN